MRPFYQFLMTFRHKRGSDEKTALAKWAFHDHDFPKYSTDYHELSNYLEWNSPFLEALSTFDQIWEEYTTTYK